MQEQQVHDNYENDYFQSFQCSTSWNTQKQYEDYVLYSVFSVSGEKQN